MNFVEGAVGGDGPGRVFEAPALRLRVPPGREGPAGPATLGVRPEHVRLTAGGNGHAATVSLIEPLGDETLVFLDYGGPGSLVAKVDAEEKLAVGDRRAFTFREDRRAKAT